MRLGERGVIHVERVGARIAPADAAPRASRLHLADAQADEILAGDLSFRISTEHDGDDAARLRVTARSLAPAPLRVDALVVELRWQGAPAGSLRFLKNGWQSWSRSAGLALDSAGDPAFPSGAWLGGMHHAVGIAPDDRAGWHASEMATVVGSSAGGVACAAGVLEQGESFATLWMRSDGASLVIAVEWRLERPLAPGDSLSPEPLRVALGDDPQRLLAEHAGVHGHAASARTQAPFQAGWCSWYHFFHDVTEDGLRRNLEALAGTRDEIPIDLIQLDDGYQHAIGDWLETNAKFPSGLAAVAREIRGAGFRAGLWTAPFCVQVESRLHARHPEWLLRDGGDFFRGLHHGMWSKDGWIHVLDVTRDDVVAHLEHVFRSLVEMGWTYQKLDFLYVEAAQSDAHDPTISRAARLRHGLEAIRRACGDDVFLLGCGCPLGPAIGVVDGMRIGPDVAPHWEEDLALRIPGLEGVVPSTRNGVRNVLARAWMHRRYWIDDPDCLMTRQSETRLRPEETRTLAAVTAVSGEMVVFSDDVPVLGEASRALVRDTITLAREIDAQARNGEAPWVVGLLDEEIAPAIVAPVRDGAVVALVNGGDAPLRRTLDLRSVGTPLRTEIASVLLATDAPHGFDGPRLFADLAPHASFVARLPAAPRVAVFCDFDGTFATLDVGSTLAQRHAGERRAAELEHLFRGELRPWEYNLRILDGLPVSEAMVDAFLRTVELDPGARSLVAWCTSRGVPFRILSDGFDRNLDRLQEIHGVRFEYDANRLRYEDDRWRIEAGSPDASCTCGTGVCKRARIVAFRRTHPGTIAVHIGDGRVSDLCAAHEADLVFAKHSLAQKLGDDSVPFEPFESLLDVVRELARRFD